MDELLAAARSLEFADLDHVAERCLRHGRIVADVGPAMYNACMAKRKRGTISIQGQLYERLQAFCAVNRVSVSAFCEQQINAFLDRAERAQRN